MTILTNNHLEDLKSFHKTISIVIPVYNESFQIINSIETIQKFFNQNNYQYEIIIVDDGSIDDTKKLLKEYLKTHSNLKLIELEKNYGKGFAVKIGIINANGDLILITDADLSVPIYELEKFLIYYIKGFEIVIGSRTLKESKIIIPQTILRKVLGRTFNFLVRLTTGLKFTDTQCGFKLFYRNVAKDLFENLITKGYAFDVEILLKAQRMGYKIKEVPITWINSKESKINILKDSFKMLVELFFIILRKRNK